MHYEITKGVTAAEAGRGDDGSEPRGTGDVGRDGCFIADRKWVDCDISASYGLRECPSFSG